MQDHILLTIDTSTNFASVSLSKNYKILHEIPWLSDQNHSLELMPNIKNCLEISEIKISDITHLAVALGPGGFSSLRVGISTALGISLPNSITTLGIPTFLIEFFEYKNSYNDLFAFLPAGRNKYAWKKYKNQMTYFPDGVDSPKTISKILTKKSYICGESAKELSEIIEFDNVVSNQTPSRSSKNFIQTIKEIIKKDLLNEYQLIEPIYSRPPNITKTKKPLPKWRIN
tara:strand:+ start:4994 stop:5680 length:687 start_codon:yes stop_codon:yes gene_type:complete